MNFKRTFFLLAACSLLGFLGFSFALAQNENSPTPQANGKSASVFCSKIAEYLLKIDQKITDAQEKIKEKRTDRSNNLNVKRSEFDAKANENRIKWDENRNENYIKMEERLDTDAKKQSLEAFKLAIGKAVSERRVAIDAAQEVFRKGVDQLISERKTKVDDIANSYKSAIESALQKSQTDCQAGLSATDIRSNLKDALKAGREKYASDKKEIDKIGEGINPLIDARKTAMEKAKEDFKTAVEKAKTDLKAVFGE